MERKIIPLQCPQCGAKIEIEEPREFAFCSYCGTKMLIPSNTVKVKVQNDHSEEVENMLNRANDLFDSGLLTDAEELYERILEIDSDCAGAKEKLEILYAKDRKDNFWIGRKIDCSEFFQKAKVFIDGKQVIELGLGKDKYFTLPYGEHTVGFYVYHKKKLHTESFIIKKHEVVGVLIKMESYKPTMTWAREKRYNY